MCDNISNATKNAWTVARALSPGNNFIMKEHKKIELMIECIINHILKQYKDENIQFA